MNFSDFIVGFLEASALVIACHALFRLVTVQVEDHEALLVTRFGKLIGKFTRPGLHVIFDKMFPWIKLHKVSLRRDFRHFKNVHINDSRGTTVIVDLWLEFYIADPAKALFQVEDWDASLKNVVSHSATSILSAREFKEILCDRTHLGAQLSAEVDAETTRWGIQIESLYIRNVSLLPEVYNQVLDTVSAQLNRAKSYIEELGRLKVANLEALTHARAASLVAEAKGQYALAVGRAYEKLKDKPAVFDAYQTLYELSLIRPHRTTVYRGFGDKNLSVTDAAMINQGGGT